MAKSQINIDLSVYPLTVVHRALFALMERFHFEISALSGEELRLSFNPIDQADAMDEETRIWLLHGQLVRCYAEEFSYFRDRNLRENTVRTAFGLAVQPSVPQEHPPEAEVTRSVAIRKIPGGLQVDARAYPPPLVASALNSILNRAWVALRRCENTVAIHPKPKNGLSLVELVEEISARLKAYATADGVRCAMAFMESERSPSC